MGPRLSYRERHRVAGKGATYDAALRGPWGSFVWEREQRVLQHVLEHHLAGRDVRVLDFACGTGRIASYLEDLVASCVGVDVSGEMLHRARRKLARTQLIQADLTVGDPLAGRRFDLVTAFRFFTNAEPPLRREAFKALARHAADDGYVVFNGHQCATSPFMALLRRRERSRGRTLVTMSRREMRALAAAAELDVVEIHPIGLFHFPRRLHVPIEFSRFLEQLVIPAVPLHPLFEDQVAVCQPRR